MQTGIQDIHIPAGGFSAEATEGASPFPHSMYPSHEGVKLLLTKSIERLNVKPWSLAGLLGLGDRGHVYKWISGERRPAAVYLSRLLYLILTWNPDLDYKTISAIDWTTGAVHWRDGRITKGDQQLAGTFDVPRKGELPAERMRRYVPASNGHSANVPPSKPVPPRIPRVPGKA